MSHAIGSTNVFINNGNVHIVDGLDKLFYTVRFHEYFNIKKFLIDNLLHPFTNSRQVQYCINKWFKESCGNKQGIWVKELTNIVEIYL